MRDSAKAQRGNGVGVAWVTSALSLALDSPVGVYPCSSSELLSAIRFVRGGRLRNTVTEKQRASL